MARILIACEYSGTVRDAFKSQGHHAVSCDLLPTDAPGIHYQGDIADLLDGWEPVQFTAGCFPLDPVSGEGTDDSMCRTSLLDCGECQCIGPTMSGMEYAESPSGIPLARPSGHPHWDLMIAFPPCTDLAVSGAKHFAAKRADGRQQRALDFVRSLMDAPIPRIAIENPIGVISSQIRKPDQIIQPWQHGHEATKTTCLWLKNLPHLTPTNIVGKGERHVTSGGKSLPKWYNIPPRPDRWKMRSTTFQGIADAMAAQWLPVRAETSQGDNTTS